MCMLLGDEMEEADAGYCEKLTLIDALEEWLGGKDVDFCIMIALDEEGVGVGTSRDN